MSLNRVFGWALVSAVLLVSACMPGAGTSSGPVTVRIGLADFPPSGLPWSGVGAPGQYVWSEVFDALTVVAPDGAIKGALAESWVSKDPRTWDFRLRTGVTFSNGEKLDAGAVAQTFRLLLSPEGKAQFSTHVANYAFISGATALDDRTVEITASQPNPLLPNAVSIIYVVPPRYFQEQGVQGFASRPVGTGPFTVSGWGPDRITLQKRRSGSWRATAGVEQVQLLLLKDPAARLQALQSGQIDVAGALQPDQLDSLGKQDYRVVDAPKAATMGLALITDQGGPLEKPEVRQALNYAVNKETIVKNLYRGLTKPGVWAAQGAHGYSPDRRAFPYDLAKARQLLAGAGYPSGFDMTAEVVVGQFPADAEIYQAMAADLRTVGVNVDLRTIDFNTQWLPKFSGRAKWSGSAFGLTWNAAPLMDGIRPFVYFNCQYSARFYCDQQAQPLIARVNSTFEVAARDQALKQLLDYTMQNPPAVFLVESRELWATRSAVRGFGVVAFNMNLETIALKS